jgi:hypothetical protein
MAFLLFWRTTMETRQPPTPRDPGVPAPPPASRPTAESTRPAVLVRVSILNEGHDDEEEKEAGYGHGV